jgi:hypothetical protein
MRQAEKKYSVTHILFVGHKMQWCNGEKFAVTYPLLVKEYLMRLTVICCVTHKLFVNQSDVIDFTGRK